MIAMMIAATIRKKSVLNQAGILRVVSASARIFFVERQLAFTVFQLRGTSAIANEAESAQHLLDV